MFKGKGLIGYLPEIEGVTMLSHGNPNPDVAALKQKWQLAEQKTKQRQYSTDLTPDIQEITHTNQTNIDQVLNKVSTRLKSQPPIFGNWTFKSIEINKLVTAQKTVNVEVASDLVKEIKDKGDVLGAIKIALNSEPRKSIINISSQDQINFTITTRNQNFGLLGWGAGEIPLGNESDRLNGVTFTFGGRLSYVNVVHFGDRYFLKDGYHRVYGLMMRGFTHTPCILTESNDSSQLPQGGNLFNIPLMLSQNPPIFRDFAEIAEDIELPDMVSVMRLKIEQYPISV